MQSFLRVWNAVLGTVNLSLLGFLVWLVHWEFTLAPEGVTPLQLNALSFQINVLTLVVALIAIVLAVLGFLGFQMISERAEIKADKAAREVVSVLHQTGQLSSRAAETSFADATPYPPTTGKDVEDDA